MLWQGSIKGPVCAQCRCAVYRNLMSVSDAQKENLPKVKFPARILEKLLRSRGKKAAKKHQEKRTYKGPLIISSKKKKFNHYQGQHYSDFSPQCLSSGGWKNKKSKGDFFTINATSANPAWQGVDDVTSFADLGLNDALVSQLRKLNIVHPTNIQCRTIPLMLEGKNLICAAETGSGKTLAFLLPLLQMYHNLQQSPHYQQAPPNHPRGLILTPSRELADQIYSVAESLCGSVNLKPQLIVGGRGTQRILKWRPQDHVDFLITTPGVCSKMLTTSIYHPSLLSNIILDEADTLLDDSFSDLTLRLIGKLKVSSEKVQYNADDSAGYSVIGTQVALVSATMPRDLQRTLKDIVPVDSMEIVTTNHLHRIMPHVSQKFMRVSNSDKPSELVDHLKRSMKSGVRTLIFANRAKTAAFISYFLEEQGFPNTILHADMSERLRHGRFDKFQSDEANILVCTDIASRGLDTVKAQHVINYDFPNFVSDYIHRVGRVGRVGSPQAGFALSFISNAWEVDLLWQIETAARKSEEFHNVNANIKRKIVAAAKMRDEMS